MEQNKEFIGNAKMEQLTEEEMEAVAGGSGYKLKFDVPSELKKILAEEAKKSVIWETKN